MFEMPEYRAYKLLWLICLPFKLIFQVAEWGVAVIAIIISASLDYDIPTRIVIALAIWFVASMVLIYIPSAILFWFIKRGFYWMVDVVPVKADSVAEAKLMAIGGPATSLYKKLATDIGNWTDDDTDQLVSVMSWKQKLFFQRGERLPKLVARLLEN